MLDNFGALVVYKIRGGGGAGLLVISHDGLEIAIPCCFMLRKPEII